MDELLCPICADEFKREPFVSLNCCSGQKIHLRCYSKSLPRCPFCRAEQPRDVFNVIVMHIEWRRILSCVCFTILGSTCMAIAVISGNCSKSQSQHP